MVKSLNKLYHSFRKILSPKYCLNCLKNTDEYLCRECLKNLKFEINFNCLECGRRVYSFCSFKNHSTLIKFLISFSSYENISLNQIVLLGKNKAFEIFTDFGKFIGSLLKNHNLENYFLVPVPLTHKKLLERGFNQTEILVRAIAKETNQKIFTGLTKIKETEDQANLNYQQRLTNLQGAFDLKDKPPSKVIIVDDIKTTGITLKECARVLKAGGTKEIIALTILR